MCPDPHPAEISTPTLDFSDGACRLWMSGSSGTERETKMTTNNKITIDTQLDGARGTLGNLKRTVALMGFDCDTVESNNVITVTVTFDGTKVANILARADRTDDAALVWTAA